MQKSFPKRLEEQVARLSAYMSLPDPASGNSFFRLVRLPSRGRETVVDLSSCGFRYRLRVTRFLKSMRQNLLHYDSNSNEPPQRTNPSIEISSSYLNANDSAIKMFDHLNFNDFSNDLEDDLHADHFFLFYTDSEDFGCRAVTNPHKKQSTEDWTLLINHSYGLELSPPRRLVYDHLGSTIA